MITRSDMETELVARLQVASNSSLFPASRITTLIKNAHRWATNLFIWTDLVQAKISSTQNGYEYYDFPSDIRSNTIIRLEIDGDSYERKNFEDYLDYKENNSGTTKKMFANYGRYFFVNPTPTSDGTNNLTVWGTEQADDLDDSTDTTIFSNSNPEGNEAIVQRALGIALKKINKTLSESEIKEATITLAKLNLDEAKATQRDQRIDHPKFNVPNMYGNYRSPGTGQFAYQP